MSSLRSQFAILTWVTAVVSGFCADQLPQPPFPIDARDSTGHLALSAVIEKDFTDMALGCIPGQAGSKNLTLSEKNKKAPTTGIPSVLQKALPLTSTFVKQSNDQAIELLFTYVYSDAERQNDTDNGTDATKFLNLPVDGSNAGAGLQQARYGGTLYGETCSSTLNGKVDLSGGYSLPIADFKAAVESDASSSTSWSLNLVDGTFLSPLPEAFDRLDAQGVYPRLVLWKWYYDQKRQGNSGILSSPNWLLQRFRGLSVYKVFGAKAQFTGTASAGANLDLAFLKSNFQLNAQLDKSITSSIRSFQVLTYVAPTSQKGDRSWYRLPTADEISGGAPLQMTLKETSALFVVGDGGTHVHHQSIQGFPSSLCTGATDVWKTEGDDGDPIQGLKITSVGPDSLSQTKDPIACTFEITYRIPSPVPSTSTQLKYWVAMRIDDQHKLRLQAAPVTLAKTDGPRLADNLTARNYSKSDQGSGNYRLDWIVKLNATETSTSQLSPDNQTPAIGDTFLQCGSSNIPLTVTSNPAISGNGPRQLQFTVSQLISPQDGLDVNATTGFQTCSLTGTIGFLLAGGITANRPIPSNLMFNYPPIARAVIGQVPSALQFNATPGSGNPAIQSIPVSNIGSATLKWQASVVATSGPKPWLTVTPAAGSVDVGAAQQAVTASVDVGGLPAGTYTAQIAISGQGVANPATIPVTLTVAATSPPSAPK
jgi:hypothetical protein